MPDMIAMGFCAANTFLVGSTLVKYGTEWSNKRLIPLYFDLYGNAGLFANKYMLWVYPSISVSCIICEILKTKQNENNGKSQQYISWEKDYMSWTSLLTSTLMLFLTNKAIKIATKQQEPTIGGKSIAIILAIGGIFTYYGIHTKPVAN